MLGLAKNIKKILMEVLRESLPDRRVMQPNRYS